MKNLCASASLRLCVESDGLAGLILAGGEGSRFGGPKAWALLPDGRTFLETCAAALREAGADPILATLPPESEDPQIDGLEVVPLPTQGLDMFASLRIGLQRLVAEGGWTRVALLPVDHPLVQSETIATMALSGARAVIPSFLGKHGHPVIIDRVTAEGIASSEMQGPTLREVLRDAGAVEIQVGDSGTIANCNTPEAMRKALSSLP